MKAQLKNEVAQENKKAAAVPVTMDSIQQAAVEYLAFRDEMNRVTAKMAKLKNFLRENLKDSQAIVGEEVVYIQYPKDSESFDLEEAEEILSTKDAKILEPYIEVKRSLDWDAAKKLLVTKELVKKFEKFVTKSPNTPRVAVKKLKENEE